MRKCKIDFETFVEFLEKSTIATMIIAGLL